METMSWRVSNNLFVPGTLNSIHVQLSTATFLVSYVEIVQETADNEWEKEKEVKKKPWSRFSFFVRVFSCKKSLSKPINMRSSFKDRDARNPTVETVQDLDAQSKR